MTVEVHTLTNHLMDHQQILSFVLKTINYEQNSGFNKWPVHTEMNALVNDNSVLTSESHSY